MLTIEVIKPGMFTSIQDGGRFGMEAYGISQGGFMDQKAGQLANRLVGNAPKAALLEITGTGPTLRFLRSAKIAIAGGEFCPLLNGEKIEQYKLLDVPEGAILKIPNAQRGFRGYLAVKGKLIADQVYNSSSTHFHSAFGGFKGRTLQKGDVLEIQKQAVSIKAKVSVEKGKPRAKEHIIALHPGPESDTLTTAQKMSFSTHQFVVSNQSNRMGYRLSGKWIQEKITVDTIISSGNVRGVVQLPTSLEPIILMNDAGTTGGYPRIGVCDDPDEIAQIKPGSLVRFQWI